MLRLRAAPPNLTGDPLAGDVDGRCEADVLIVGGDVTPGLVVISKAGIPYTWDKRKGYGYGGAWLIFTGTDLAEFDTTFTIWREDQHAAWALWAKKYLVKPPLKPQQNGAFLPNIPQPKALGVANPILSELGIKKMVPLHIGQWIAGTGPSRGKWTKMISWYQWKPPVPMLGRPDSAKIPDKKGDTPTADDKVQMQIQAKLAEIKARQARIATLLGKK